MLLFHPTATYTLFGMVSSSFCLLTYLEKMQNCSHPYWEDNNYRRVGVKGQQMRCEMMLLFHPPTIVKVFGMGSLYFYLYMSPQKMQKC